MKLFAVLLFVSAAAIGRDLTPESIAAARSKVRQPEIGRIATNTLAFERFGLNQMLEQGNLTRRVWHLDCPPLTVNQILFWLKPRTNAIDWIFATRDGHYSWQSYDGWFLSFIDNQNSYRAFYPSPGSSNYFNYEVFQKMAHTKSKVDRRQAVRMARDYLHALGLTQRQLRLHEPPTVEAKHKPVPLFTVGWSVKGAPADRTLVEITISGITSNIVEYLNGNPNTPPFPMPTNYFEMLGLPANYLETLPAQTR